MLKSMRDKASGEMVAQVIFTKEAGSIQPAHPVL
jgi:hypothetical protein